PCDRPLNKPPRPGSMQIGGRMIARADHIIDGLLDDVGLLPVEPELMPPLVRLPVALRHRVVAAGGLMIEAVAGVIVLDCVFRASAVNERADLGEGVALC